MKQFGNSFEENKREQTPDQVPSPMKEGGLPRTKQKQNVSAKEAAAKLVVPTSQEKSGSKLEFPISIPEDFTENISTTASQLAELTQYVPEDEQSTLEVDLNRLSVETKAYFVDFANRYFAALEIGGIEDPVQTREVFAQPLQIYIKRLCVRDAGDKGDKIGNPLFIRMMKYLGIPEIQIYHGHIGPEDAKHN